MNSLFNHAVRQSQTLKTELDQFAVSPENAPLSLQGQISATLTSFQRTIDDYSRAAENELVPERKEKANVRINNFKEEIQQARDQFKKLKQDREESLHTSNKQELFARRVPHSSTNSENPYSNTPDPSSMYSDMSRDEGLRNEGDILRKVGDELDRFMEQGLATLGDLKDQSQLLRGARQTMVNVGSTLGLSNETIRMVERRAFQDKWLFYAGVILMLLGFYFILKWFG